MPVKPSNLTHCDFKGTPAVKSNCSCIQICASNCRSAMSKCLFVFFTSATLLLHTDKAPHFCLQVFFFCTDFCLRLDRTCPAACGSSSTACPVNSTWSCSFSALWPTMDRLFFLNALSGTDTNHHSVVLTFFFFCQGLLSFALFGLDKHLIILPFKKR